QQHIPELNHTAGDLSAFSFHVDGDVFRRSVAVLQAVVRLAFKALVDCDYTHVSAVGLTFQVAYIVDVIPLDAHAVVVQGNEVFKVLSDIVVADFFPVQRRYAHFGIGGKQFFGAVHNTGSL